MPLFVTDKDVINVTVRYVDKAGSIQFFEKDEAGYEAAQVETFTFRKPNWADTRLMMADAMYLDPNSGSPIVDPYRFMDRKIKILLKDWSLKDGDAKLPLNGDNIDKLDGSLINYLNKKLDEHLTPTADAQPS